MSLDLTSPDIRAISLREHECDDPLIAYLDLRTHQWWVQRLDGSFAELYAPNDEELQEAVDWFVETLIRMELGEFDTEEAA